MNKELLCASDLLSEKRIEDCIFTIRGHQVMFDSDIARFYEVETKALNQQMKRNINRFPQDFCFQLTDDEFDQLLRSQNVTSNSISSKRRYKPYVYTEHGIISLAGVIKSDIANKMSVEIARTFIQMRKFILENGDTLFALAKLQNRQLEFENKTNKKFDNIIKRFERMDLPKSALFYDGQWFDAYDFIASIISKADFSIILVDPYCDEKALTFLTHKKDVVQVLICYSNHSKLSEKEISIFESQYGSLETKTIDNVHDRYLIIDRNECYSLGASLNYAGKKLFTINRIEEQSVVSAIIDIAMK